MNKEEQFKVYAGGYNHFIYDLVPSNTKVLDVGCNTGELGLELIKNKKCIVYGIDYSVSAIEITKSNLNKAKVIDLNFDELPFSTDKFDVIVFGDVLEHIINPDKILNDYKKLLNKNGIIIASIPNVANINIRWNLFWGNWNYKKWGILDRTHLKFFTYKTIKKLFLDNGYSITSIKSTPGCSFFVLRYLEILKYLKTKICKIYPRLFALQFIVIAKKNGD